MTEDLKATPPPLNLVAFPNHQPLRAPDVSGLGSVSHKKLDNEALNCGQKDMFRFRFGVMHQMTEQYETPRHLERTVTWDPLWASQYPMRCIKVLGSSPKGSSLLMSSRSLSL